MARFENILFRYTASSGAILISSSLGRGANETEDSAQVRLCVSYQSHRAESCRVAFATG
jgi:hypothetical protein